MKNLKPKIIFSFLILFSLPFFLRLYHIQIKNGEYYQALALGQYLKFQHGMGKRGEIFLSGEKIPLAQTTKKYLLYLFRDKIKKENNFSEIIEKLSKILNEDQESLIKSIQERPVLTKEISRSAFQKLSSLNFKGIYTDTFWGRVYPQKELAAHVVGFLNRQGQGQYGIEGYFDKTLKGKDYFTKKTTSPFGFLIKPSENLIQDDSNHKGADIILTINYNIQYFAEEVLKKAVEKWKIDGGEIIVSEPSTGKILAMAVYPSFDPNEFQKEKNLEIFLNPSLQKLFEPGSIFKPITMAAGLEEGLVTPETTYEDKGWVDLGGPRIYNFQKRSWGEQTMTDVLAKSINTGAVFVEQLLGKEKFLHYVEKFGFFEKTGIPLQGEIFSKNETLKHGYPRDFAVASFGQGIEVTSIQIVRAFGAIANGGWLMKPQIVEKIIKNGQTEIFKKEPQRRVISSKTSQILTSMLVNVVEKGSAWRAKIPGYQIAAKTGTAQVPLKTGGYSPDKTIQSFVGYFPVPNPQFLIFIKLENPKKSLVSGISTAPLFKMLAQYIINLYQIPPQELSF